MRKVGWRGCCVLSAVLLPALFAQGGVRNGDFSAGKDGWELHDAAKVEAGELVLKGGFALQFVAVKGGTAYKVSMRAKAEGAAGDGVFVQASFRGKGVDTQWRGPARVRQPWGAEKCLIATGGDFGWKTLSCVIKAPPGADNIVLYLRNKSDSGTCRYDDVTVETTDEPETTAASLKAAEVARAAFAAGKGPRADWRVSVASDADLVTLNAAKDMAEYLGRVTGRNFLPVEKDLVAGKVLAVGRSHPLAKRALAKFDFAALGEDGFAVRSAGDAVVFAGATPGGTMYAVNWFLDRKLGVKFTAPGCEYVPRRDLPDMGKLAIVERPRFTFRQILGPAGQDKRFAARNLLNGNSHGAYGILAPAEIDHFDGSWQRPGLTASFDQLFKSHDDCKGGGQVKMMSEKARQVAADEIIARLRKGGAADGSAWFGFMDNDWGWDMDPASAKFAAAHGGRMSAPRFDMAADVLARVRKALPAAKIAANAYHWSFTPPTGLTLPDGLLVYPMTIHLDYSTDLFSGRNVQLGKDLEAWNGIAKDILLWDHVVNFSGFLQPTPNLYPIATTLRKLSRLEHFTGYFAEGGWNTPGTEFDAMRTWLMARLLWNPELDARKELSDYCNAHYGKAGAVILEYIDFEHARAQATRAPIWEKTQVNSRLFDLDFVMKADAILARAAAAVKGDETLAGRVASVQANVDYVALVRRQEFESEAVRRKIDWRAEAPRRAARLKSVIRRDGVIAYRQGGNVEELMNLISVERHRAELPAEFASLPKGDVLVFEDLALNRYGKTPIVADVFAGDGAAAVMNGRPGGWYVQFKLNQLPEDGSKWNVYYRLRVDRGKLADNPVVVGVGAAPPMNRRREIRDNELPHDGYALVEVPGSPFAYSGAEGDVTYVTAAQKDARVYVDGVVLVRKGK